MDKAICGARSKTTGQPCQKPPLVGGAGGRCKLHGGATPRGPALPQFKTGRYSGLLPAALATRYEEALRDDDLTAMRDEIALVDTRIASLLAAAAAGEREDSAAWTAIEGLILTRVRLVDQERKRLVALQQTLTVEQALGFLAAVLDVLRRNVEDPDVLARIGRELGALAHRHALAPNAAPPPA